MAILGLCSNAATPAMAFELIAGLLASSLDYQGSGTSESRNARIPEIVEAMATLASCAVADIATHVEIVTFIERTRRLGEKRTATTEAARVVEVVDYNATLVVGQASYLRPLDTSSHHYYPKCYPGSICVCAMAPHGRVEIDGGRAIAVFPFQWNIGASESAVSLPFKRSFSSNAGVHIVWRTAAKMSPTSMLIASLARHTTVERTPGATTGEWQASQVARMHRTVAFIIGVLRVSLATDAAKSARAMARFWLDEKRGVITEHKHAFVPSIADTSAGESGPSASDAGSQCDEDSKSAESDVAKKARRASSASGSNDESVGQDAGGDDDDDDDDDDDALSGSFIVHTSDGDDGGDGDGDEDEDEEEEEEEEAYSSEWKDEEGEEGEEDDHSRVPARKDADTEKRKRAVRSDKRSVDTTRQSLDGAHTSPSPHRHLSHNAARGNKNVTTDDDDDDDATATLHWRSGDSRHIEYRGDIGRRSRRRSSTRNDDRARRARSRSRDSPVRTAGVRGARNGNVNTTFTRRSYPHGGEGRPSRTRETTYDTPDTSRRRSGRGRSGTKQRPRRATSSTSGKDSDARRRVSHTRGGASAATGSTKRKRRASSTSGSNERKMTPGLDTRAECDKDRTSSFPPSPGGGGSWWSGDAPRHKRARVAAGQKRKTGSSSGRSRGYNQRRGCAPRGGSRGMRMSREYSTETTDGGHVSQNTHTE
jgi:hypothetical protein